jgi:cell division protein FtsB
MPVPVMVNRRELQLAGICAAAIWSLEAVLLLTDGEQGVLPWLRGRTLLEDTRAQVQAVLAQRDGLTARAAALRSDPRAIQAAARAELGMVFPGELVLQLEPKVAEPRP